ncbi:MAG: ABC transporter ATP-binding protein [Candidatus Microbacterium colombiense]|nr:MAG: ABC transporter ATP-binding protein [Microbacterium sp.]
MSWLVVSIVLEMCAIAVLAVTVGWVGSNLYDGKAVDWRIFALLMAAFVLLRASSGTAAGTFGARVGTLYRRRALVSSVTASPDRVKSIGPGSALSKALDVEVVGDFLARASVGWILGSLEVGAAGVLILVSGLPVLMVGTVGVAVALLMVLGAALVRARRDWRSSRLSITAQSMEGLLGLETTQILDRSYASATQIDAELKEYRRLAGRVDAVAVIASVLPTAALVAVVLILFLGGSDPGAPGTIAAGIGIALLATSGIERLAAVIVDTAATMDAAHGLRELESFTVTSSEVSQIAALAGAVHQHSWDEDTLLEACHVTATFALGQGLTRPVDIVIRDGDRLLISAPSGFGKTTLGEVLSGEREPTGGVVRRRDGVVITRVLQADDDHMFGNSLLFNVASGVEWPPSDSLQTRARALMIELGLGSLLDTMPAGFAQPVGEGGWRLSTGERTRVSIAAALLREPDVLILDESIATLDGETREKILAACVRHSRATLLFAHWD